MQAEGSSSRAYDPEEPRQAQTQTVTLLQSQTQEARDRASVFALHRRMDSAVVTLPYICPITALPSAHGFWMVLTVSVITFPHRRRSQKRSAGSTWPTWPTLR